MRKFFSILLLVGTTMVAQQKLVAKIDIAQKQARIEDKLFGMFMENLGNEDVGNLTDDCLWSELLDDRKFFYPVDNKDKLVPKNRKEKINQWIPVGADVTMDQSDAYVGKQSPKITTNSTAQNGISQTGIWLEKNKKYTGHIILKASPGVSVTVSLNYGTPLGTINRSSSSLMQLTNDTILTSHRNLILKQEK